MTTKTLPLEPTHEILCAILGARPLVSMDGARRLYAAILAAAPSEAEAIRHAGCNYLGVVGQVCTKCGRLVDAEQRTAATQGQVNADEARVIPQSRQAIGESRQVGYNSAPAAVFYGVRNDQGFWAGLWNDRANAELVVSKGQRAHGERVVELVERQTEAAHEPGATHRQPVAESQAPYTSEQGDRGVAPALAGGVPDAAAS